MKCPRCEGTGRDLSGEFHKCPKCKGTGEVERSDGIDYNKKIAVPEHKAKHE